MRLGKWNETEDEATFGKFSTSLDSMGEGRSEGDLNALLPSLQNEQDPFILQWKKDIMVQYQAWC